MKRLLISALGALLLAPAALAATAGYDRLSFRETGEGRAVAPPLDEFRAYAGASVVVPRKWTRLAPSKGRPRYRTAGGTCRFRVTWTVRSVAGEPGDADAQLAAALSAPARAHVYEEGERNGRPFRVVKMGTGSTDHIRGAWVAVLTRRRDVAPAGQVVWAHITADARAGRDEECHSGTIHGAARDIADGLSLASARLRFVER